MITDWILRRVSDFEYYMGGTVCDIDFDDSFRVDREEGFHAYTFNGLVGFGLPEIVFYSPYHTINYGYEFGFSVAGLTNNIRNNGYVNDTKLYPAYSTNGFVNVIMTVLVDLIADKIPITNIHNGKYNDKFVDNTYTVCLMTYSFTNTIHGDIKAEELKKYDWRDLNILNFHESALGKWLKTLKFERNFSENLSKGIPDHIVTFIPEFVWLGLQSEASLMQQKLKVGLKTSADLVLINAYDGKGKGSICKFITFLNPHTLTIRNWTMDEFLHLHKRKPDLRVETLLGDHIVLTKNNIKEIRTKKSVFIQAKSLKYYLINEDEIPYSFKHDEYVDYTEFKRNIQMANLQTKDEYDEYLNETNIEYLPPNPEEYYSKEATEDRIKEKAGALWV